MRAWTSIAFLLALGAAFSGCFGGGGSDEPEPGRPFGAQAGATGRPLWVHTLDGVAVPASRFAGDLPAFELLDVTQRISGEPTIGVSRTGAVFYPSIDFDSGVPDVQAVPTTVLYRSIDEGRTWHDFSPHFLRERSHLYSFDPYVYSDLSTGRVYTMDMGPHVACNKVSWSDDDGRTWTTRDGACPLPGADHPTLFSAPKRAEFDLPDVSPLPPNPVANPTVRDYPNTLFLCSNQVADVQCSMSLDGGLNWLPSQPVYRGVEPGRVGEGQPEDLEALCGSLTGHGHGSIADGTVYLGKIHCHEVTAAVSRDGGVNWEVTVIASDPRFVSVGGGLGGEHDVSIGADMAGTAYAFWVGNNDTSVYYAFTQDQGRTWSEPRNVTAPGVTAVKLPSLVAGEAGRIAFQYVATTTPSGWEADDTDGDTGERLHRSEWLNATWHAYVGVILDATAEGPVVASTTVNDPRFPLKRGGCEDRCINASGQGGLYDFLDIDIDPRNGRVWTALVDVCTVECDEPSATAEAQQRAFGVVGRQAQGTMLLDSPFPFRQA